MILASELAEIIKKCDLNISKSDIQDMITEVDYHGNGKINYSEFLSATIDVRTFLTKHKLRAIFSQFDTDNSGKITAENIYFAMQKLGQEIPKQEIVEMIESHDIKGDGVLSFEEFECIFFDRKQLPPGKEAPFGNEGPQVM